MNFKWIQICFSALCMALILLSCDHKHEQNDSAFWKSADRYDRTSRMIDPKGYIDYLKKYRYTQGELDSLPAFAIIMHDARVGDFLYSLGVNNMDVDTLITGTTDPNVIYVVRSAMFPPFMISPGLPGTAGITTQAAELNAMGVNYLVHIGTCGIMDSTIKENELIVSSGAYMDEAAALLAEHPTKDQIALPDQSFSEAIFQNALSAGILTKRGLGFTIPVFYYQPTGLLKTLLKDRKKKSFQKPQYIEMEGAGLFALAEITHMKVASLQAGTDRYTLQSDSVVHSFMDYDSDMLKLQALRITLNTFKTLR